MLWFSFTFSQLEPFKKIPTPLGFKEVPAGCVPLITFLKFFLGGTIPIGFSGVPLFRMTCNNMAHLAESGRLHALLMGLEHRYYGGKAFDGVMNFSVENLKFLSSHSLCYSCCSLSQMIIFRHHFV